MTLGERIYLIRRRRGWTQKELGAVAGVHRNTIARLERSEISRPSTVMLEKLVKALGVTADYLLFGREGDTPSQSWASGVAFAWRRTTPVG